MVQLLVFGLKMLYLVDALRPRRVKILVKQFALKHPETRSEAPAGKFAQASFMLFPSAVMVKHSLA
jgi:hypothetical protein